MRGKARLERALRRWAYSLRPAPAPRPVRELLDQGLLPAEAGRSPAATLRDAFRFPHSQATLDRLAACPEANRGLLDLAAAIAEGNQPYFQRLLPTGESPDWLRVPEGGGRVHLLPFDIYTHADHTGHGDMRLLAELGRLQALPPLCAAQRITGQQDYGQRAWRLLRDFRECNPVDWGPQWISHLEAALRIFSMLWAWGLAGDLEDEELLLLGATLLEHGRAVEAHLAIKPIANNHLIGEAAALHALGHALPVFPESECWREKGRQILAAELEAQVLADGVDGEQASEYHRFVLEFYLQALLWEQAAGLPPDGEHRRRLAAMLPPLVALTGPDGHFVALGDDDSGRILRLDDLPRRDARGLLVAAARLLDAELPAALTGPPDGEGLWLLGEAAGEPRTGALNPVAAFPDAGWFTSRFGEPAGKAGLPGGHLVFRAGPMGRGGAGHSHADLLSLCLADGGLPLLVDPGAYLYNGPMEWRDHFRGGRAHSILRVGGRDAGQLLPAPDRFGWERKAAAHLEASHIGPRFRYWQGRREGDRDAAGRPLRVWRRLLQVPPELILVLDQVLPDSEGGDPALAPELDLELLWQGGPRLEARWREDDYGAAALAGAGAGAESAATADGPSPRTLDWLREGEKVLEIHTFAPSALRPFLWLGRQSPPGGWYSEDYGVKVPAPCAGLAGRASGAEPILSLLALPRAGVWPELMWIPGDDPTRPILEIRRAGGEGLLLAWALPGSTLPGPQTWPGGLQGQAELVALDRGPGGELRTLFAANARELSLGSESLLPLAFGEQGRSCVEREL